MSDDAILVLTVLPALGCGLIGGVFFAFASFIMRALAMLPPAQGLAAMQAINITVLNPLFLGVFLGTGAGCGVLAVVALANLGEDEALLLLAGSLLYLIGSLGVTMACNVPRNNRLAAVDTESATGAEEWARYVREWTMWNTVRTIASLGAAVAFMAALASG